MVLSGIGRGMEDARAKGACRKPQGYTGTKKTCHAPERNVENTDRKRQLKSNPGRHPPREVTEWDYNTPPIEDITNICRDRS